MIIIQEWSNDSRRKIPLQDTRQKYIIFFLCMLCILIFLILDCWFCFYIPDFYRFILLNGARWTPRLVPSPNSVCAYFSSNSCIHQIRLSSNGIGRIFILRVKYQNFVEHIYFYNWGANLRLLYINMKTLKFFRKPRLMLVLPSARALIYHETVICCPWIFDCKWLPFKVYYFSYFSWCYKMCSWPYHFMAHKKQNVSSFFVNFEVFMVLQWDSLMR